MCANISLCLSTLHVAPQKTPLWLLPTALAIFKTFLKAVGLEQKVVCGNIKNASSDCLGEGVWRYWIFYDATHFQCPSNEKWAQLNITSSSSMLMQEENRGSVQTGGNSQLEVHGSCPQSVQSRDKVLTYRHTWNNPASMTSALSLTCTNTCKQLQSVPLVSLCV